MMKCAKCGATGCKLWRQYQTFNPQILCVDHAGADQGEDVSQVDDQGLRPRSDHPELKTDTIGWYVPAVPSPQGYWGYTSVPAEAITAWKALPTRMVQP